QLYKKYNIIALVRKSSNISRIEKFCKIYYYEDINSLRNILLQEKIHGVIHLATLYLKNHKSHQINNLVNANITFGAEILEVLYMMDYKGWFINTGTFWQFYKNIPNNPLNLYAATKTAFLRIVDYYVQVSEIKFTTILLNDTYGANDWRQKIFNLWLNSLKTQDAISMSFGEQAIDMLYVDDVINAFEVCISLFNSENSVLLENRLFTLHSKERKTLRELAVIFENCIGRKLNIIWGAVPYSSRENFIPYEKDCKLPNWEQKISFEEGFKKIYNSYNFSATSFPDRRL
ncbi:NAD(P)-dependent oxidoreductase, partial [Campylobacter jejuni]|nr:NAD(P)-dependent oxidoreductase [Campylobacter jejuni]EAL5881797.1 NAD(P)-dependent oxidoreductase [Campylobacter jejuni]ECP4194951.1 NAD(P)-dependent oxidoreductase [Campylobacter jejuni]